MVLGLLADEAGIPLAEPLGGYRLRGRREEVVVPGRRHRERVGAEHAVDLVDGVVVAVERRRGEAGGAPGSNTARRTRRARPEVPRSGQAARSARSGRTAGSVRPASRWAAGVPAGPRASPRAGRGAARSALRRRRPRSAVPARGRDRGLAEYRRLHEGRRVEAGRRRRLPFLLGGRGGTAGACGSAAAGVMSTGFVNGWYGLGKTWPGAGWSSAGSQTGCSAAGSAGAERPGARRRVAGPARGGAAPPRVGRWHPGSTGRTGLRRSPWEGRTAGR